LDTLQQYFYQVEDFLTQPGGRTNFYNTHGPYFKAKNGIFKTRNEPILVKIPIFK